MTHLLEFPSIIINSRLEEMGMEDCTIPITRTVAMTSIRDYQQSMIFLPKDKIIDGTVLVYHDGDRIFVTVPIADMKQVFQNNFNELSVVPYTNYLTPSAANDQSS